MSHDYAYKKLCREYCNRLQQTATTSTHMALHGNRLQQTATDCNRLHQTATDCNRLQQTATDSIKLQHTPPHQISTNNSNSNKQNWNPIIRFLRILIIFPVQSPSIILPPPRIKKTTSGLSKIFIMDFIQIMSFHVRMSHVTCAWVMLPKKNCIGTVHDFHHGVHQNNVISRLNASCHVSMSRVTESMSYES